MGAAARHYRHHPGPRLARLRLGLPGRDEDRRQGVGRSHQHQHRRLWHQLARRPHRQVYDRTAGPPARGRGLRQRVPLPESYCRPRLAGPTHHAIRRDRRHPGRAARDESPRLKDRGHLQRGGCHGGARGPRLHLHPCRPGDRRRLHQGLHRATDRIVFAGAQARPAPRPPRQGAVGGAH